MACDIGIGLICVCFWMQVKNGNFSAMSLREAWRGNLIEGAGGCHVAKACYSQRHHFERLSGYHKRILKGKIFRWNFPGCLAFLQMLVSKHRWLCYRQARVFSGECGAFLERLGDCFNGAKSPGVTPQKWYFFILFRNDKLSVGWKFSSPIKSRISNCLNAYFLL